MSAYLRAIGFRFVDMEKELIKLLDDTMQKMQIDKVYSEHSLSFKMMADWVLEDDERKAELEGIKKELASDVFSILEEEKLVKSIEGDKEYRITLKGRLYESWEKEQEKKIVAITVAKKANKHSYYALGLAIFTFILTFLFEMYRFFYENDFLLCALE